MADAANEAAYLTTVRHKDDEILRLDRRLYAANERIAAALRLADSLSLGGKFNGLEVAGYIRAALVDPPLVVRTALGSRQIVSHPAQLLAVEAFKREQADPAAPASVEPLPDKAPGACVTAEEIRAAIASRPASAPARHEPLRYQDGPNGPVILPAAPTRPHCDDHAGWRSDCDRCAMYEPPPVRDLAAANAQMGGLNGLNKSLCAENEKHLTRIAEMEAGVLTAIALLQEHIEKRDACPNCRSCPCTETDDG